jgi:hypothetical protein
VLEMSKRLGGYSTGQQPLGVRNIHLGSCSTTLGDLMVIWLGECSLDWFPTTLTGWENIHLGCVDVFGSCGRYSPPRDLLRMIS